MSRQPTKEEQRVLLRALCSALMQLDRPLDLAEEERAVLEEFTDAVARAHGFSNWVEAYHADFPKQKKGATGG